MVNYLVCHSGKSRNECMLSMFCTCFGRILFFSFIYSVYFFERVFYRLYYTYILFVECKKKNRYHIHRAEYDIIYDSKRDVVVRTINYVKVKWNSVNSIWTQEINWQTRNDIERKRRCKEMNRIEISEKDGIEKIEQKSSSSRSNKFISWKSIE